MKQAFIAVVLLISIVILTNCEDSNERVYDCGMAEWHPDIPTAVREECRRRALEHWREQQNKKFI